MSDVKAIRKHAAQHDLFNRIHSIASDEQFVRNVADRWFRSRFKVVANQRCGTWYCDPSTSSSVYAYFKSTDGHTLNWDFNLRRSNLPLAEWAERHGGLILVDSTRRGKRMPDGLSKTVPIWCAVVNRAIALRRAASAASAAADWDEEVYLPAIVSPSERSQIQAKLDDWAEKLEASVLPLPDLTKPLRPFFIHPSTSRPPEIPSDSPYTPIICLSASRWVNGDDGRGDVLPTATRLGDGFFARTVAFEYVPGAGDDDELWGRGLKPALYHEHKEELLSARREDLPTLVDDVVREQSLSGTLQVLDLDEVTAPELWACCTQIDDTVALDLGPTTQHDQTGPEGPSNWVSIRVVEVPKTYKGLSIVPLSADEEYPEAIFAVPCPRAESKAYILALRELHLYLASVKGDRSQQSVALGVATDSELNVALSSTNVPSLEVSKYQPLSLAAKLEPAKLVEVRKVILPIALTLLCGARPDNVDKEVISSHLHRLVALWPDGNPPRAALKRINEFYMSTERA